MQISYVTLKYQFSLPISLELIVNINTRIIDF